jgi:hypothetical protein
MTPLEALLELLARLGASQGAAVLVSEEELGCWPVAAVQAMKSHNLLAKARPAASVVCPGCEQECAMPVHTLPAGTRRETSFVICDKRSDVNRVAVPSKRLRQWRCSAEAVCRFVAQSLELRPSSQTQGSTGLWEIGLATGNRRSQMLCLQATSELELVAGNNAVPLAELARYKAGSYAVDSAQVQQLVDAATTGDSRYTPSNARREARKLDTQALHERWRKEYRAFKKRRPEMSDKWYSQQIAKMDIAQGRNAETIRKHMHGQK